MTGKCRKLLLKYKDFLPIPHFSDRDNRIAIDLISGMTVGQVGNKYGLSRQRISQIGFKLGRSTMRRATIEKSRKSDS